MGRENGPNLWQPVIIISTTRLIALREGRTLTDKVPHALEIIGQSTALFSESSLHLIIRISIVSLLLKAQLQTRHLMDVRLAEQGSPDI